MASLSRSVGTDSDQHHGMGVYEMGNSLPEISLYSPTAVVSTALNHTCVLQGDAGNLVNTTLETRGKRNREINLPMQLITSASALARCVRCPEAGLRALLAARALRRA